MRTRPHVFLKAARAIYYDKQWACCFALGRDYSERYLFTKMFEPENPDSAFWYGEVTPENQLARQLGLLLCAEVLKDETKAKRKRK